MKDLGVEEIGPFRPNAWHHKGMDFLEVYFEDVAYVARDTKDPSIDLYQHPRENRIVGLRIWGFSQIRPDWFPD